MRELTVYWLRKWRFHWCETRQKMWHSLIFFFMGSSLVFASFIANKTASYARFNYICEKAREEERKKAFVVNEAMFPAKSFALFLFSNQEEQVDSLRAFVILNA